MYRVAFADGKYSIEEEKVIEKIVILLEISAYDHRSIKSRYLKDVNPTRKYYETLGVNEGAAFEEIKKAYRELSRKYHPDKVSHLGKEFSSVAVEKMKEINEAYDYFRKKFGK